ncbi:hypothetical protein [Kineococcus sp. NPDC059986]|uniref:hypothetical protein n=1 Tax=Kineococcus sp. NPDC059986 TaxID=3155538 RepID=UPI00344EA687
MSARRGRVLAVLAGLLAALVVAAVGVAGSWGPSVVVVAADGAFVVALLLVGARTRDR